MSPVIIPLSVCLSASLTLHPPPSIVESKSVSKNSNFEIVLYIHDKYLSYTFIFILSSCNLDKFSIQECFLFFRSSHEMALFSNE